MTIRSSFLAVFFAAANGSAFAQGTSIPLPWRDMAPYSHRIPPDALPRARTRDYRKALTNNKEVVHQHAVA